MNIQEIWADMSRKAATIDPLGKTLIFHLDNERPLIDGAGERSAALESGRRQPCAVPIRPVRA